MGKGTWNGPTQPLSDQLPGVGERPGQLPVMGLQHVVSVQLVTLTAADTTYVIGGFVAPSDGWYVEDLFYSAQTTPNYATSTIAVENYDKSGTSAKNLLSATNEDLETLTAKQGRQASLSTTQANRLLDEGDTINFTVAIGSTEVAAGKGLTATIVLRGPEVNPQ